MQLHPESLGQVQIALVQPKTGPAQVQVLAERPATLAALVRDQGQLQAALDRAGIPGAAGGRTLSFHLASAGASTPASGPNATTTSLGSSLETGSSVANLANNGAANSGAGDNSGGHQPPSQTWAGLQGRAPSQAGTDASGGSGAFLAQSGFGSPGQGGTSQRGSDLAGQGGRRGAASSISGGAGVLSPLANPSWFRAGLDITA